MTGTRTSQRLLAVAHAAQEAGEALADVLAEASRDASGRDGVRRRARARRRRRRRTATSRTGSPRSSRSCAAG